MTNRRASGAGAAARGRRLAAGVAVGRGGFRLFQRGELLGGGGQRRVVLAQARDDFGRGAAEAERQQRRGERAQRGGPQRRRARRGLQMAGRILVPPQAAEQAPQRQPRGGGLVAAPLRDQAFVDEPGLAQIAGARMGAGLVDRRAGAAVEGGGAPPVAAALGHASRLERTPAPRERVGDRGQVAGGGRAVGDLGRARGQVGVQRQPHRQAAVADLQRQGHRVGEAPDAFVERDRAPQLAALGGDARRLDVGAVRDEVFNYVGHLPRRLIRGRHDAIVPMILGVFGGSGLYDIDGLADVRTEEVATPFGPPSAPVVSGTVGDTRLLFLPRHGAGHRLSPSEINYRANVFALKTLGAQRLLSISAVGSLREELAPGDFVLADQFIDRTFRRATSFFGDGVVGHVGFAEPTCPAFGAAVAAAAAAAGRRVHRGGTYLCMEGPAVLDARRVDPAPQLGGRRGRHDRRARGQAGPRGRALLRGAGAGHRLRRVARRRRRRQRRVGRRGAARQRRRRPAHRARAGRARRLFRNRAAARAPPLTPSSPRPTPSRRRRDNAYARCSGGNRERVFVAGRRIRGFRFGRDTCRQARRSAGRRRVVRVGGGVVLGAAAAPDRDRRRRLPRRLHEAARIARRRPGGAGARARADVPLVRACIRPTSRRAPRSTRSSTSSRTSTPSCRRRGRIRSTCSWPTSIRCCSWTC